MKLNNLEVHLPPENLVHPAQVSMDGINFWYSKNFLVCFQPHNGFLILRSSSNSVFPAAWITEPTKDSSYLASKIVNIDKTLDGGMYVCIYISMYRWWVEILGLFISLRSH